MTKYAIYPDEFKMSSIERVLVASELPFPTVPDESKCLDECIGCTITDANECTLCMDEFERDVAHGMAHEQAIHDSEVENMVLEDHFSILEMHSKLVHVDGFE